MEQPRTRPQQHGPRRGTPPPLPPQGRRGGAGAARPARPSSAPVPPSGRPAPSSRPAPSVRPARVSAPAGGPVQRRQVTLRRPAPPVARPAGQASGPRLTGLGGGLFCGAVMVLLGWLDLLLFDGAPTVYGVLFLPVCALTALWVRRGDLLTAPVVVPIAFTAGALSMADGGGGLGSRLMGMITVLATQAGWLYGGTLVAALIAIVRRVRARNRRRRPPVSPAPR
ncbi:DUF6542 domain-containing protein [Streptomyces sp. NPDC002265]|uniref:DUF6542 domain-containing protein n=1 Tax=Streptomyces sp. NPDC002265 TaxID=3154415 RepID=UPI003331C1F7